MSKCRKCNIEILDVTEVCPLCQSVLEQTEEMESMYPDAGTTTKRRVFVSRIYSFLAILVEIGFILFDINRDGEVKWSIIVGLALLYGYTILRYAILGKTGYRSKIIVLTLLTVLVAIAVDFATGYHGWSVDFVLSASILVVDIGIVVLMICNRRNWQSYLLGQLLMILCSLIPLILHLTGIEKYRYVAIAPFLVSALLFLGTWIIGGQRATTELKRRFHI